MRSASHEVARPQGEATSADRAGASTHSAFPETASTVELDHCQRTPERPQTTSYVDDITYARSREAGARLTMSSTVVMVYTGWEACGGQGALHDTR